MRNVKINNLEKQDIELLDVIIDAANKNLEDLQTGLGQGIYEDSGNIEELEQALKKIELKMSKAQKIEIEHGEDFFVFGIDIKSTIREFNKYLDAFPFNQSFIAKWVRSDPRIKKKARTYWDIHCNDKYWDTSKKSNYDAYMSWDCYLYLVSCRMCMNHLGKYIEDIYNVFPNKDKE